MKIEKTFRLIVAVSFVTGIAGALVDLVFPGAVPKQLSDAYEALTDEAWDTNWYVAGPLAIACLVGLVASNIGLFLFKPWARTAYFSPVSGRFGKAVVGQTR